MTIGNVKRKNTNRNNSMLFYKPVETLTTEIIIRRYDYRIVTSRKMFSI